MLIRILIVGSVFLLASCTQGDDQNPSPSAIQIDGKSVYTENCASCHDTGQDGAPILGDTAAWASRVPELAVVLKTHAVNGFILMPPKGGNSRLSDGAVSAAVDYMIVQIKPPSVLSLDSNLSRGRDVYASNCGSCHDTGQGGAPVIGDNAAWAKRSPQWSPVLKEHAKEGFFLMPPKGNYPELSDDDVAAAVDYMLSWLKKD